MRRKAEADAIASKELVIQDDTDINMRMSMFSYVYGRCEKSREDTEKMIQMRGRMKLEYVERFVRTKPL